MSYKSLFFGSTDNAKIQFFRYLFVGGTAFVVDFSLMWALVELAGMHVILATTLSFLVGLTTNYILSILWVFNSSTLDSRWKEFIIFALIGIAGLVINDLIIALFQYVLAPHNIFSPLIQGKDYYLIGKIVATIIVFIWNFAVRKVILFSADSSKK